MMMKYRKRQRVCKEQEMPHILASLTDIPHLSLVMRTTGDDELIQKPETPNYETMLWNRRLWFHAP